MALHGLLPGPAELAVFAGAVLVLNATPGVDFALTVGRTLQAGARAGVAAAAGILAGCAVHALAAAFGLAAVLALHPAAFTALQWAGAAYLAWLGLQLLWGASRRPTPAPDGQSAAQAAGGALPPGNAQPLWAHVRAGLLTNVLNPKVALFFLAFLPPFVPAGSPSKTLSFLLLGAWFIMQGGLFLLALVAVAARLAQVARAATPGPVARMLQAAGGLVFLGLALRLLRERPLAA